MKTLFSMFLALCASLALLGQAREIEFVEYELDNGLKVILHEDHSTPIVAVSVMYHVGSKNEEPGLTGFAHFFEHLLFEGSANINRGEFDMYIQQAGGANNANTSWDRTFYYEILPSNQLEMGLWLESERMLHAKVETKGIEVQREVVKEERRERIDNQPYGSIAEEIFAHAFKEHPYKWPIIGYMKDINNASEEDFLNFYETFYVPNNAILSIAGDINIDEAKGMIEKYFATIPKGTREVPRPTVEEPPLGGEVRDTVYDNIQLPAVIQSYRTPAQGTEDYYALSMLSTLLSTGQSSRMYKSLVDEQQLALQAASIPITLEDPGLTVALAIANFGVDPKVMEDAMDAEIDKVKNELITEREFQKLRNQVENNFVSGNSRVAGIAESLANYEMYFGDANLINTELDRYMAVTREDIQAVAQKYLTKDNRVVLYYLAKQN